MQSLIGRQKQNGVPQVSLHSAGVDQPLHDPNCAGQVLDAWQVAAVAACASRIASGSLANAAFSISGDGAITARVRNMGVVSSNGEATSILDSVVDSDVGACARSAPGS